jgi:hypothetical protein
MKCDLCDQEFANSEELKRHQESVHPMGDSEGDIPKMEDMAEPAERQNR